jgi:hypothetical protein
MIGPKTLSRAVAAISVLCAPPCHAQSTNAVLDWNLIVSNTAVAGGQSSVVQTRTFAMVQAAVHDALNAIDRRYELYVQAPILPIGASPEAAVATAAHNVLVALIPAQSESLDAAYATALASIADGPAKEVGVAAGKAAAAAILALRAADGAANANRPYTAGTEPGDYQLTNPTAPAVTPGWGDVAPFALKDPAGFRPPPLYSIEHHQYAEDFAEVKRIGAAQSTERSDEQTQIARFWAEPMATMWNRMPARWRSNKGWGSGRARACSPC